jgi:hypothetical protein
MCGMVHFISVQNTCYSTIGQEEVGIKMSTGGLTLKMWWRGGAGMCRL